MEKFYPTIFYIKKKSGVWSTFPSKTIHIIYKRRSFKKKKLITYETVLKIYIVLLVCLIRTLDIWVQHKSQHLGSVLEKKLGFRRTNDVNEGIHKNHINLLNRE